MTHRHRVPLIATMALAFVALGACAENLRGVVVTGVDQAHGYDPLELSAAGAGGRALPVAVIGNPFPEAKPAVDAAVVESMQGNASGIPIRFALDPADTDPQRPYRVVVVFGPALSLAAIDVCKDQAAVVPGQRGAEPGRVMAMGVLCSTDFVLSQAKARAPADTIAAPAFRGMIAQLTRAMFPARNPNDQNDGDFPVPTIR